MVAKHLGHFSVERWPMRVGSDIMRRSKAGFCSASCFPASSSFCLTRRSSLCAACRASWEAYNLPLRSAFSTLASSSVFSRRSLMLLCASRASPEAESLFLRSVFLDEPPPEPFRAPQSSAQQMHTNFHRLLQQHRHLRHTQVSHNFVCDQEHSPFPWRACLRQLTHVHTSLTF